LVKIGIKMNLPVRWQLCFYKENSSTKRKRPLLASNHEEKRTARNPLGGNCGFKGGGSNGHRKWGIVGEKAEKKRQKRKVGHKTTEKKKNECPL